MNIPSANDLMQYKEWLKVPEIRVWCHPHFTEKKGEDYYRVFKTFRSALWFIEKHKEAERVPLIAFMGKELNIFGAKYE
jgi:hypothetical protein